MSEHDELQALIDAATPALAADAEIVRAGAERFEAHGLWHHELRRRARKARRILLVGMAVYVVLMSLITVEFVAQVQARMADPEIHFRLWRALAFEVALVFGAPLSLAGTAAVLAGRRTLAAQVGSRAILWGLTLLVALVEVLTIQTALKWPPEPGGLLIPGAVLAATLAFVGALLVLGDHGLRTPARGAFRPVAFRRLLSLSLIMGLADVVVIASVFVIMLAAGRFQPVWLGLGAALCIAAYGLARLRTWGLAAMAVGNLAEVVLAVSGQLTDLGPLIGLLMITAAVQLLLPVPVYGAMIRGHVPERAAPSWLRHVPTAVLGLVALTAIAHFGWAVTLWTGG